MKNRLFGALATFIATLVLFSSASAQLSNPGFESGTVTDADNWTEFNNAFRDDTAGGARTGSYALKLYGNGGAQSDNGAFQDFPITPGKTATLTGYAKHLSTDAIGGTNLGLIQVAYLDASDNIISASDSAQITASTATDVYQTLTASLGAAPGNVAKGRVYVLFIQFNDAPGAMFVDDLSVVVADPPPAGNLLNKSFELGSGISPASWAKFGNAYRESVGVPARTGTASLKMFGNFNGLDNSSGAYQYFACAPGQTATISAFGQNWINDAMQASNRCVIKLVFLDASNNEIGSQESTQAITNASPLNQWVPMSASMVAPAGTAQAAFYVLFLQPAGTFNGGAAWVDDCDAVVSGGGTTVSGLLTLEGIANPAGEQVTFQIRNAGTQTVVDTQTVTLGAGGSYSFTTTQTGTKDISFKGAVLLRKTFTNVNLNSNVTGLNGTTRTGDCVGDNVIDLSDYTAIALAFNALLDTDPGTAGNQSSPNWNAAADLNEDGVVDLTDYTYVATNFNALGDN